MAQTGYTPILIYSSSTASQAPSASNLTNSTLGSELAINITDGKLFYKDNGGSVQVIAWKVTPTSAGGTGLTSYTAGDTLYYATGTTLSKLAIGASKTIMTSSGSAPQWSASLDTSQGGTGNTSYTAGDMNYYASGTSFTKLAIGASTTIMTSTGTAPQWSAASGVSVGTATNIAGGAAGSVPYQTGAGATSLLAIGTAYQMLGVNAGGTAPSWQPSATSVLTTQGDLLYASAANTLARLAKNTTASRYLSNSGSSNNPSWAQVDLSNGVTGTLPVGNGGTGQTSWTASGILYASGTGTLATASTFLYDGSRFLLGTAAYTTSSTQSGEVYSSGSAGFLFTNSTAANYAVSIKNQGASGTRNLINFYEGSGGGTARTNISLDGSNNFTIINGSGGVYLAPGGTSWTAVSDERKKDIIEPISDAANKVSRLRAVIGKYKNDEEGVRRSFLIAQDVKAVLPEAVNTYTAENDETEYFGLSYSEVIPLLVAAIKELKTELDSLKTQVDEVKR